MRHDKYSDPVSTFLLVAIAVCFVVLTVMCIYDCHQMSVATQANLEALAEYRASLGYTLK